MQGSITPNLWFDTQAEEAADSTAPCSRTRGSSTSRTTPRPARARRHGDDGRVRARRPALRRHQRRPGVHVRRGHLVRDRLRGPGGGRPLLGAAHRGRRGEPVRLAQDRFGLSWQVVPTGMGSCSPIRTRSGPGARWRRCSRCASSTSRRCRLPPTGRTNRSRAPSPPRFVRPAPVARAGHPRVEAAPARARRRRMRRPGSFRRPRTVSIRRPAVSNVAASSLPWWPSRSSSFAGAREIPEPGGSPGPADTIQRPSGLRFERR